MKISKHRNLSSITSFETGGEADVFVVAENSNDVEKILQEQPKPYWLLGSGANTLISDQGLPGTTIQMKLDSIEINGQEAIVESGVNWDDFVQAAIEMDLWGVELTSGIPGSVGAAVVGNIAAYGQAVSDTLAWIDVIDHGDESPKIKRMHKKDLDMGYRSSMFTKNDSNTIIILRACFELSESVTTELKYESALVVARELELDVDNLEQRREAIMETRRRGGSLLDSKNIQKTAGSFFKNPMVTAEQAEHVMEFEERKITKDAIKKQNVIHGGDAMRVSAAHVVLASGFERGQAWGPVRIHPDHALKIENTGGATSQQIYDVAKEIQNTAKEKLGIDLEFEVRVMGHFD
jgi:UDP-N-acetylmuramate dehydrogenase